jgi:hypothetical protein
VAKEKVKVLVKIYSLDEDGDEKDIIRQFTVQSKDKNMSLLAFKLAEVLEKKMIVEDMEGWPE